MRHRIIGILLLLLSIDVYAQENNISSTRYGVGESQPVVEEEPEEQHAGAVENEEEAEEEEKGDSAKFIVLKNNFFQDALLILNAGIEFGLNDNMSISVPFTWSPYELSSTWRYRTLSVQPEFRYWFDYARNGFFAGAHAQLAWYNISSTIIGDSRTRYQDRDGKHPLVGGGLSVGYGWLLGKEKRLGLELVLGGGYAYLDYDTFYNVSNGALFGSATRNYWGVTNLGFNISYRIDSKKERRAGR